MNYIMLITFQKYFLGGYLTSMAIAVGNILDGVVTGITNFGAFIDLGEKQTGLVHISEVANDYVKDINEFLKVQDKVKVKVLNVDEKGKISLSIKQAQPKEESSSPKKIDHYKERDFSGNTRKVYSNDNPRRNTSSRGGLSFEEKMNRFLKDSDERLSDLKRNTESKRGGRGGRRE